MILQVLKCTKFDSLKNLQILGIDFAIVEKEHGWFNTVGTSWLQLKSILSHFWTF